MILFWKTFDFSPENEKYVYNKWIKVYDVDCHGYLNQCMGPQGNSRIESAWRISYLFFVKKQVKRNRSVEDIGKLSGWWRTGKKWKWKILRSFRRLFVLCFVCLLFLLNRLKIYRSFKTIKLSTCWATFRLVFQNFVRKSRLKWKIELPLKKVAGVRTSI